MKKTILLALLLGGCTQPAVYTDGPMQSYDQNTTYWADDTASGFRLTINYSRYQMIPESSALAAACKQSLTAIAYEVADSRKRQIKRIEEQRIKISFGRNGVSGMTSCSASVPVEWQ